MLLFCYALIVSEQILTLKDLPLFRKVRPSDVELNFSVVNFDFDKRALFLEPVYVQRLLQLSAFNTKILIYDFNLQRSWLYLDLE